MTGITRTGITRRAALLAGGALAAGAADLHRLTLDLGHRGSRGGPLVTLPGGSILWATTEPEAPYLAKEMWRISRITLRRSQDGGRSWDDPRVILRGTESYSLLSHALRVTARGTLLHVFVKYSGYDYETAQPAKSQCEAFLHRSTDGGLSWSTETKLPTGERYIGDVLSMEQLRDGRLVYPFAFLTSNHGQFAVSALYSDDDGATWTRSGSVLEAGGAGFESGASEPTVTELPDGRLWMLIRAQTGFLWQSFSSDRGRSWTTAAPSPIPSSNAPATALRLRSGKIAVAWNNHVSGNYARQSLALGITADPDRIEFARELDGTDFPDNGNEPPLHTTYPYLTEPRDGVIAVSYNKGHWMRHNRPALAVAPLDWLAERSERIDFREGRSGWRSVNPGPQRRAALERYAAAGDSQPGASVEIEQPKGITIPVGMSRALPLVRNGTIAVVAECLRPEGFLLFGDTLLAPGEVGEACVRVRFAADRRVFVASGVPNTIQRDRRSTKYTYLQHAVENETAYPQKVAAGSRIQVDLRFDAETRTAAVRIASGPEIALRTGKVLGLSWIAIAVAGGGLLRLRSVETTLAALA